MKLSSEEIALIEKYVDGHLSESETKTFDEQYRTNTAFKKEAELQKQLMGLLVAAKRSEQKDRRLKEYRAFKNSKKAKPTYRLPVLVGIAATILIVSFLSIFKFGNATGSLFDAYYQPYSGPKILRGESGNKELMVGLAFYKKQRYAEALPIFKALSKQDPASNNELNLLMGICHLELGDLEKSKYHFGLVNQSSENYIGEWYYNMALLKERKFEEVRANMLRIATSDSPYQERAKKLVEELR